MNKEELMLQKHLIDLSETAYKRDIVTFSDFLNLNELNILHSTPKNMFSANYETYGGYEASERQMVAFLPDALYYEYSYPVSVLKIVPSAPKFAEQLTHRDYLGAVLNLGIERCKIGDLSRSKLTGFITDGKVFVNGRLITSNGYHLKERDVISVRGMGKISYNGVLSETKKGRFYITVNKYV